jgi:hypothetical protein
MEILSKSMADTVQPIEVLVQELLELRQNCTQSLSDEIVRRIHSVRSLCKEAEAIDGNGQINWRKVSSNTNGYHGSNNRQSFHPGSGSSARWRGSGQSSPNSQSGSEKSVQKYVSKFKNSDTPVEDKILNQVILNKLNKFSNANYQEIKEFLEQILDSNEKDFLHDFMLLVFKKAASEPTFCPLYARMISELSAKYDFLFLELNDLYNKYINIFDAVVEENAQSYEQFVQRNREKIHRLGYSQFLGELTGHGVLNIEQIKELYMKILSQLKVCAKEGESKQHHVEEYVDCLCRMTIPFKKGNSEKLNNIRLELSEFCEPIMSEILANRSNLYSGLTKKSSFAIMDCIDIFRGTTK